MSLSESDFKLAMSHFASGVTVVATETDGQKYGMTVASFASLSLRPPLVLVCIEKSVKTHDAIVAARKFGISVLTKDQADLSNRFASRSDDKFAGVALQDGSLGVPLLADALATIECSLYDQLSGGDHSIFVGQVEAVTTASHEPLVYYRSAYREITG
ncbi:MAG TPA: flavin reductase family protein [Thermoanaerobaculia bacterium]|nr:flavin reductase family protein [Thermoanaerobaculia bacterium]